MFSPMEYIYAVRNNRGTLHKTQVKLKPYLLTFLLNLNYTYDLPLILNFAKE